MEGGASFLAVWVHKPARARAWNWPAGQSEERPEAQQGAQVAAGVWASLAAPALHSPG